MEILNTETGQKMNYWVIGEGNIMQSNAIQLLRYVSMHPSDKMSITKLENGANIPRMSVHWLLRDAAVRGKQSTLAVVAKDYNFNVQIDINWNILNKFARTKPIIRAHKVSRKSHTPHVRLKNGF